MYLVHTLIINFEDDVCWCFNKPSRMQYYNFIRNFYLKMHFEEFQRKQSYVQLKPNNHISKAGMKAVFRYILIHRTFEGINIQRGMYVLFYIIYHTSIFLKGIGQLVILKISCCVNIYLYKSYGIEVDTYMLYILFFFLV